MTTLRDGSLVEARAGARSPEATALVPAYRYTSRNYVSKEQEKLWPAVWQLVCRLEDIPHVGDYLEYLIGDQSILIVRSALHRKESRGLHYTLDYPATLPEAIDTILRP